MDQVIVISWGFYPFSFMPSFCFSHLFSFLFFSFRMQHYLQFKNTKGTKLQSTVDPINYNVITLVMRFMLSVDIFMYDASGIIG
jgi:hypothetical protein